MLGVRSLDELTWESLARLVGCEENDWLDVKGAPNDEALLTDDRYWKDLQKGLAADVVSFSNREGGLIVVGAQEVHGTITSISGIPKPQRELALSLEQSIMSQVRPIPTVTIRVNEYAELRGRVVVLILVHRGQSPPYSVEAGINRQYLIRQHRGNRHLSEPEIASLFRRRFDTERRLIEDLDHLDDEIHRIAEELIPNSKNVGHIAVVGLASVPSSMIRWLPTRHLVEEITNYFPSAADNLILGSMSAATWAARTTRRGVRLQTRNDKERSRSARILLGFDGSARISWGIRTTKIELPEDKLATIVAVAASLCIFHGIRSGEWTGLAIRSHLAIPETGAVPTLGSTERRFQRDEVSGYSHFYPETSWTEEGLVAQIESVYRDLLLQAEEFEVSSSAIAAIRKVSATVFQAQPAPYPLRLIAE